MVDYGRCAGAKCELCGRSEGGAGGGRTNDGPVMVEKIFIYLTSC